MGFQTVPLPIWRGVPAHSSDPPLPAKACAPIHFGDPTALGIADIGRPDIGAPVSILPGEIPVFWACIATIWNAARRSKPSLFISHAPGCMFITDQRDQSVSD